MTEQAASVPAVEKWIVPFGANIEILHGILKAYYIAGADAKFVSSKDIVQRGVGRTPLVNNRAFLINLGALEREKPNSTAYKLTSEGLEYSKAVYADDKEKMKGALIVLIDSSFKELSDYVKLHKNTLNFEDLFNHIKTMARVKEDEKYSPWKVNPAHATGIFALIDMLKVAGLVEDTIKPATKSVPKAISKARTLPEKPSEKRIPQKPEMPSRFQFGTQIQAQVVVDVKDSKSISNFLKMMKILKRINDGEDLNIDDEISVSETGNSGD